MSNHFKVQNDHQLHFWYSLNEQILKLNNMADPVEYVAEAEDAFQWEKRHTQYYSRYISYVSEENTEGSC